MTSPTADGQGKLKSLCPECRKPVARKRVRYGQVSYDCDHCNSWGPWREVINQASLPSPPTSGETP